MSAGGELIAVVGLPDDRGVLLAIVDTTELILAQLPPVEGATITAVALLSALPQWAHELSALAWRLLTQEGLVYQFPEPTGKHMLLGLTQRGLRLMARRSAAAALVAAAREES